MNTFTIFYILKKESLNLGATPIFNILGESLAGAG